MLNKIPVFIAALLLLFSFELYGQLNATQARHESLNQDQITVTLDGNLAAAYTCVGGCLADWTLNIGGGPVAITSVIGAVGTNRVTISFATQIGIGESVVVNHTNDGTIDNIVNLISENNWVQICDDFEWISNQLSSDVCAPVTPINIMVFTVTRRLRNSSTWDPNNIRLRVAWGDAGNTLSNLNIYESNSSGVFSPNSYLISADASLSGFSYPGNENVCGYGSNWRVRLLTGGGTICPIGNANQFINYSSFNTDAAGEGDGTLSSQPTIPNTDLVCEGDFVNMSFDDISDLNCIDAAAAPPPFTLNSRDRNIRVIYGFPHDAGNTIRNVFVAGTQITDANGDLLIPGGFIPTTPNALGTPDGFGVVNFPSPVAGPAGTLEQITTSTVVPDGDAGRTFNITIQYWNFCNSYDGVGDAINNNAREITDQVLVIPAPPVPTGVDNIICQTSGLGGVNFSVANTAGSTAINWYDDDPELGGVLVPNPNGGNSTTFPAASFPGGLNTNTPGEYTMWATYVLGATNTCESPAIESTITVRESLSQPAVIAGSSPICNNTNGVAFSVPAVGGPNPFGGAIEYEWDVTGGGGVTLSSTTGDNITADFNIGGSFVTTTRNIRVRRIYSSAPECDSPIRSFTVTIFGQTLGGSTGPDSEICEGDNTGTITLTGHRGTILNWERQVNGGGFIDIGNNGNATFSEVLATEGTYEYRAVVDNGPCSTETSSITTITVNPIPDTPTISQVGDGFDICENGDQVILQSSNADGNADEYAWFKDPDYVTPVQQSNSNQLILTSVAESGTYAVQVIGINPTDCESALSATVDVVINPLPTATVSGGGSVCAGIPGPPSVITFAGTGPWDVTYERNGNPTTANAVTSPFIIPGSTTVTDDPDTYIVTSVTDLGTTINCTVNAPSPNITGSATIQTSGTPPPTIDGFTIGPAICDDGAGTALPSITLDLFPDAVINYDVEFEIFDGTLATQFTRIINRTTNGTGTFVFNPADLDYADLSNTPDTYTIRLLSIINTASGCNAAGLPVDELIIINPRPADPTNPVDAIACSSDATGATMAVDDPGAGFVVRWYTAYTDETINTPAIGVAGGVRDELFTPTSNATQTYLTVIESTTAPTNCHSVNTLNVQHTQDLEPTAADADLDDDPEFVETCDDMIVLEATPADNGGTGTWSYNGLLYYEDFKSLGDGTIDDNDLYGWARDVSGATFDGPDDHFEVRSGFMSVNDTDGEVTWQSDPVDISGITNFDISIEAYESTINDANDYIELYYQIDANPEVQVGVRLDDDFTNAIISGSNIPTGGGTNLIIRVKTDVRADADGIQFDNIILRETGADVITFTNINDPNALVAGIPITGGIPTTTTLTWTVSSALGACNNSTDNIDVIRLPLPVANDLTPELCEDLPRNSNIVAGVDLTTYAAAAIAPAAIADRTVEYFDAPARGPGDVIGTPTSYDITNGETIYLRITDINTSTFASNFCTNNSEITFTVNTLPEALDISGIDETTFCEQVVAGPATVDDVDLTTLNDNVSNSAPGVTVEWFVNPGPVPTTRADLTGNEVPVDTDVDGVADGTIFYAIVQNATTLCEDIAEVEITVLDKPDNNPIIAPDGSTPATLTICSSTNVLFFQVSPTANPGSEYIWTIPNGVGELIYVGGGTTTDFFVLLQAPDPIVAPGVTLSVQERYDDGFGGFCLGNVNSMDIIVDDDPPAPVITGPTDVCANQQNVNFSIAAPVGGSTYTWSIGSLGSIVSGQGSPTITVNIGATSDDVTVIETNATGCTSPVAAPLSVSVNPNPVMTSPNAIEFCSGGDVDANLTLTSSIGGSDFDWEVVSKTPSVLGTSVGVTGTGQIPHTLTNFSGADGTIIYEVTPTSPAPASCQGATQVVTITVFSEPVGQDVIIDVCSDEAFVYDIQVSNLDILGNGQNANFIYSVTSSDPGNVPADADRVAPSPAAISTSYNNTTGAFVDITYEITPIEIGSGSDCAGDSFDVVFRINPEPVVSPALATLTVCSDELLNLTLNTNGTSIGADRYDINLISQAANVTTVTQTLGADQPSNAIENDQYNNVSNTPGDVVYEVIPKSAVGDGDCTGDAFLITVTIDPEPVVSPALATLTVCSDELLNLTLNTNGTSIGADRYDINLISQAANVTTVTQTLGADQPSNAIENDQYNNVSNTPGDVVYEVIPKSAVGDGDCTGDAFLITVTIDPEPVVSPALATLTVCSDELLNLTLNTNGTSIGADRYDINLISQAANVTTVTQTLGADQPSNAIENDQYNNVSNTSGDVVYEVIPKSAVGDGDCTGDAFLITVTIDPEPVVAPALATLTVCSDELLNLTLNTNGTSIGADRYDINLISQAANVTTVTQTLGADQPSNAIENDQYNNVSNTPGDVVYEVIPKSAVGDGDCTGDAFLITVTIDPEPVVAPALATLTVCSDELLNLTLNTNGTSIGADRYDINLISQAANVTTVTQTLGADQPSNAIENDQYNNVSNTPGDVVYEVIPKSAVGDGDCTGDAFLITVTIDPEPVVAPALATLTVCSDELLNLTLNTNGTSIGADRYDINLISQAANVTTVTQTLGADQPSNAIENDRYNNVSNTPGDVVYEVIPKSAVGDGDCTGDAFLITVTIDPEPVVAPALATLTVCSDELLNLTLNTNGTSIGADRYDINLISQAANVTTVTQTLGADQPSNAIENDQYNNVSNTPGDVVYEVIPKSAVGDGDCTGDAFLITVTIDPEPVVAPALATLTVCSDELLNLTLNTNGTSIGADRYDINLISQAANVTTVTQTLGADQPSNAIENDQYNNVSNTPGDVVYEVIPKSALGDGDCTGDAFLITVTIDPEPVVAPALATLTVCSDELLNLTLNTNGTSIGADRYDINLISQAANVTTVTQTLGADQPSNAIENDQYNNVSNTPGDVVYEVIPKSALGDGDCTGDAFLITVTIDPEPVVSPALATLTVCSDELLNLTLNTNGTSIGADRYDINLISQAANVTTVTQTLGADQPSNAIENDQYNNVSNTPGDVVYEVIPKSAVGDGDCTGDAFLITVTIDPEPVVAPALATLTVCSDELLNLTLNTNGTSIGADRYDINLISQAANVTTVTQTLGADQPSNAIENDQYNNVSNTPGDVVYEVIPKSALGDGDCTGDAFLITVTIDPEPVVAPALATLTVCSDELLNLTLNTNGTSIGADRYDINLISQAANVTTVTQTLGADQPSNAIENDQYNNVSNTPGDVVYEVIPKSALGDGDCTGDAFLITVTIDPEPVVAPALATLTVCSDELLNLTLNTNGTSIGADRYDINLISQAANVTTVTQTLGADQPSNAIENDQYNNVSNTPGDVVYEVIPKSAVGDGDCTGDAFLITVTIDPEPVVAPALATLTVCSDELLNLTLNTNGTSIGADRYDINLISQAANVTTVTQTLGADQPSNAIENDQYNNVSNTPGDVVYEVIPKSAVGDGDCTGDAFLITVTIDPEPVVAPALATLTVCSDELLNLTLNTNGTSIGADRYDINLISQAANVTTVTQTLGADQPSNAIENDQYNNVSNTPGDVVYEVIPKSAVGDGDCTGDAFLITVTIDPEPVVAPALATLTVCSDELLNLTLNTNGTSIGADRYTISEVSRDANVIGASTTGALLANNALFNDVFTNTSSTNGTIVYRIIPQSSFADGNCAGNPFDITVTIRPEPVGTPGLAPQSPICSQEEFNYDIQTLNINGNNGLTSFFTYSVTSTNPLITTDLGGPVSDNNRLVNSVSAIQDTYINNSGLPGTITYLITPESVVGSCEGDPFQVSVVVNSDPVGTDGLRAPICSDEAFSVDPAEITNGLIAGNSYSWILDVLPGSLERLGPNAGNGNITGTFRNRPTVAPANIETVEYIVTPESIDGCEGDPYRIAIDILPEPVGSNDVVDICAGGNTEDADLGVPGYDLQSRIQNGLTSFFYYTVSSSNAGAVPPAANRLPGAASAAPINDTYNNLSGSTVTITYTVTPIDQDNGEDCMGDPFTVQFRVIPGPLGAPDGDTYCSGEQISYDIQTDNIDILGNGVEGDFTYTVESIPPVISVTGLDRSIASDDPIEDTFVNTTGNDVTIRYLVTPQSTVGTCPSSDFNVDFVIKPEPVGSDITINDICSGDPLTHDLELNVNQTQFDFNGSPGLSSEFTFTVSASPSGVLEDLGGTPVNVSTLNRGTFSNADISVPADVLINKSATAVILTYTVTPREDQTAIAADRCIGDPFEVRFEILPQPVVDPALAGPFTVCSDSQTGITLSTNGTSVGAANYTISVNANGLSQSGGTPSSGASKTAIELVDDIWTNNTNASVDVEYTVTPFSSDNCAGDPFLITLTILPEPIFDPTISPTPVCSENPLNVMLGVAAGSVAADSYNIISVTPDAGVTPVAQTTGTGLSANAILNDRYINTNTNSRNVTYHIQPVTAGCVGDPEDVIIQINPAPNLADLDNTVCSGQPSGIQLAFESTGAPAVQYIIVSVTPDPGLNVISQTADGTITANLLEISSDVFENTTNAPLTVEYGIIPTEGSGAACNGPEELVILTVEPEPQVNVNNDPNICNGDATTIELTTPTTLSFGSVSFDVLATPLGAVTGVVSSRLNLAPGTIISDNLNNVGNTAADVEYTITPKSPAGCAAGTPTTIVVTVEPEPTGFFTDAFVTVCEGEALDPLNLLTTNRTPSGSGVIQFELVNAVASDPAVTGFSTSGTFNVGDALGDVLDIADGVGITTPQTVTYQFTPSIVGSDAGTCVGVANSVELVVNVLPRPEVTPRDPGTLLPITDLTICSGEAVEIELTTDVVNSFARWTVTPNANVDGEFDGQGKTLFVSLINRSTIPQVLTYTIEPFLLFDTNCTGPTKTVTITVDPNPDVTVVQNQITVCSGEPVNVELNGSVPGTTFNWTADLFDGSTISGSGTNGDLIAEAIVNSTGVAQFVTFNIDSEFGINNCPGNPPGIVFVTVNPMVEGVITTDDEILCKGNSKAIEFAFQGAPPFSMTYEITENGTTTQVTENNLPSNYVKLFTDDASITLLSVEDNNGCTPDNFAQDNVTLVFEEAIADFEVSGNDALNTFGFTNQNATVNLDFDTGTGSVLFRFNSFNPVNTYTLQIADEVFDISSNTFAYTFTQPSTFGTLGYFVELQVKTPNDAINSCNDVQSFFIEVLPPEPTVVAFADILEACPPFDVNFESFREDLSLSRNVVRETLTWTIDGQVIKTPNLTYTFTQPGTYNVEVKGDNGHGQEAFDNLVITAYPVPSAEFIITQEVVYIPDEGFRPTNRSQGANTFLWDFGDFNTSGLRSPEHFYELEGEYEVNLTATNDFGCVSTKTDTVLVEEGGFTKTPNAFTPSLNGPSGGAEIDPNIPGSGDLANDIFLPITTGVEDFKMWVYDRWGNLIFYSDNKRVGWDGYNANGKLMPAGVYVYKLELLLSSGQRTTRVGDITLIR